jgi:GNAT superfamily N-acetyltransferase
METQSYRIEVGSVKTLLDGPPELFNKHWEEVTKEHPLMILKPDRGSYLALEGIGMLITLLAYVDEEVVGYSCNMITPHLHYADLVCGHNDAIFISPLYRNSSLGIRMIRQTEAELKRRGVEMMFWHAKQDSALSKILPRLQCKILEITYSKEL